MIITAVRTKKSQMLIVCARAGALNSGEMGVLSGLQACVVMVRKLAQRACDLWFPVHNTLKSILACPLIRKCVWELALAGAAASKASSVNCVICVNSVNCVTCVNCVSCEYLACKPACVSNV